MATSTLNEVVLELQEQNRTLDDVKEGIKAILIEDVLARKQEERAAGDREEERREASKQKAQTRQAPKSLSAGISQGLGLDGIIGQARSVFGGALGGASLGGMIGLALGRLFPVAAGAILGANYLDKWIDPLVDKITGDDATWTMFGQEIDASKIVSGMAGVIGAIFAKDAIVQTAKGLLGIGNETKLGNYRKLIVRRFGLGALALSLSGVIGNTLEEASGGLVPSNITKELIDGVSLAMMFMPGGFLLKAMAGMAIAGGKLIRDYLRERAERSKAEFLAEVDQFAKEQELHKISDTALIAKANKIAENVGTKEYYGRGTSVYSAVEQEAYLRELEKRDAKLAAKLRIEEEIALALEGLNQAARTSAATVNITDLQSALDDFKALTGLEHSAVSELEKFRKIQSTRILPKKAQPKGYEEYVKSRLQAPRIPVQRGDELIDKIDVGASYTPNVMPKPGTAGFSLTDMFGSGNVFTNGIQPVVVDNSTTINEAPQAAAPISNSQGAYGFAVNMDYIEKLMAQGIIFHPSFKGIR